MTKPRVIFMGTPAYAVPALERLAQRNDIDLSLVVTQPDRPAGRGKKMTSPPVRVAADALHLPVLQVGTLRDQTTRDTIIALKPDLVVVAAFGVILGKWILELPAHGCVNLHASLLPKHRGASPISSAILSGDDTTGVTLMQMDRGIDTGDMLATIKVPIAPEDTTASLTPKLALAGAELLDEHLCDLLQGTIVPAPQPDGATETHQLTKADGEIDWTQSAAQIERHVRAMWDWPRAWTDLPNGARIQIHGARVNADTQIEAGAWLVEPRRVLVGTGNGSLEVETAQLPGGRPVSGQALIQKLSSALRG